MDTSLSKLQKMVKDREAWHVAVLMLSRFSRVRLCVTPQTAAHQAPLSLGFSRQEYWSGLPFPSPVHARMLSCFSHVRLCATLWTAAHQAPLSTGFSRQEHWSGLPFPFPAFAIKKEEGNGNPLKYSCLENPVDGGAWWAAVHRVAQSRT